MVWKGAWGSRLNHTECMKAKRTPEINLGRNGRTETKLQAELRRIDVVLPLEVNLYSGTSSPGYGYLSHGRFLWARNYVSHYRKATKSLRYFPPSPPRMPVEWKGWARGTGAIVRGANALPEKSSGHTPPQENLVIHPISASLKEYGLWAEDGRGSVVVRGGDVGRDLKT